jgi:hypothetical protein
MGGMDEAASLKAKLREFAAGAGVDSLDSADVEAFTAVVPNGQVPAHTALGMRSIVVFSKHFLTGAMAVHDVSTQSYNSHLALDAVIDLSFRLSEWLEDQGYLAVPLHPEFIDEDLKRSGAGLLDFKYVAEFAGLGHVGLNQNFLTPDFGSRVYLGAVLTDAPLPPGVRGHGVRPLRGGMPHERHPPESAARCPRGYLQNAAPG